MPRQIVDWYHQSSRKIGNDARNIPSYSLVDLSSAAELRLSPESLHWLPQSA